MCINSGIVLIVILIALWMFWKSSELFTITDPEFIYQDIANNVLNKQNYSDYLIYARVKITPYQYLRFVDMYKDGTLNLEAINKILLATIYLP